MEKLILLLRFLLLCSCVLFLLSSWTRASVATNVWSELPPPSRQGQMLTGKRVLDLNVVNINDHDHDIA